VTQEQYNPVSFDLDATRARWMQRPGFAEAYAALKDEFATLGELLRARKQAGMTQAEVAQSMGIAQASVARLESSAGSRRHAPYIASRRRYAHAVGCDLRITLRPSGKRASAAKQARPVRRKPAKPARKAAAKKAAVRAKKAKRTATGKRGVAMKRAAAKPSATRQRARA
jgi:transcriptional regulator with XRE-family HTH domain